MKDTQNTNLVQPRVEDYIPFVAYIVRTYHLAGGALQTEDLFQEGCLGLMEGLRYHQEHHPDNPIQPSYLARWICKYINELLRKCGQPLALPTRLEADAVVASCSLDEPMGTASDDGDEPLTMADLLPGGDDPQVRLQEAQYQAMVRRLMARLDNREKAIITMLFGLDAAPLTAHETGERMGLSHECVRKLKQRALRKMKR